MTGEQQPPWQACLEHGRREHPEGGEVCDCPDWLHLK